MVRICILTRFWICQWLAHSPRAVAANSGGWYGSCWGVMWQQATQDVQSVCHAASLSPSRDENEQFSQNCQVRDVCLWEAAFCSLNFLVYKKHSLLPYLVVSSRLFKLKQGRILYAFFFEISSYPLAKAVWLLLFAFWSPWCRRGRTCK